MAAARVILVSDSHLSASAPRAQANWDAVVAYVAACRPDLVIHLSDLSLDGTRSAADLRHGRAQLDRLQLLGSGLEAEAAQWSWLEEQAGGLGGRPPVAVITHKPITTDRTELAAAPSYRFWPPDARERLARPEHELVEPDGLEQLTLTVDLPDPYHG